MGQGQSPVKDVLQLPRLAESYCLGKTKLGEGAYGTVWKGTDRKTSGVVAVKQLSKAKLSQGGKLRHNTEREVVMMRACQHENIAQLFGVFQDDKSVYLVMECCDGGDIGERVIGSKSNVHEEQLAEWSRQMCAAVAALHGLRICHRDLKPQNYMLTRNSMLKLSDFGLAVFLPEGQVLSERCGTPAFMSPELHLLPRKSRGYSFPADAWALGLCIYMVIYRHHPFVDSRGGLDESSLLTGRLTFGEDDSSLGSLLQSIKNGIGAGSPPPSGPGSIPEVRQLCAHLTHADETSRMTAAQALQSIWCGRGSRLRHAQAARSAATSAAQSDTSTQVSDPSRTSSKQSVSAGSSSGSGRLVSLGGYPQADDEPRSWASDSKILARRSLELPEPPPQISPSSSAYANGSLSMPLSSVARRPIAYNRSQSLQNPTSMGFPSASEQPPSMLQSGTKEANLPNLLVHQPSADGKAQEPSPVIPAAAGVVQVTRQPSAKPASSTRL